MTTPRFVICFCCVVGTGRGLKTSLKGGRWRGREGREREEGGERERKEGRGREKGREREGRGGKRGEGGRRGERERGKGREGREVKTIFVVNCSKT